MTRALAVALVLFVALPVRATMLDPSFTESNYVYTATQVTGIAWARGPGRAVLALLALIAARRRPRAH